MLLFQHMCWNISIGNVHCWKISIGMLTFQHRVTIPNPLQPPHLLNFEVSNVHYQNEISITFHHMFWNIIYYVFCAENPGKYDAEIEVKNHHSDSHQSAKMKIKEWKLCRPCVAMLQTLQTIAKKAISGATNWGNIWKAIQMKTLQKGTFLWHMKTYSGTKSHKFYRFCIFLGRQFGDTIENKQCRKVQ